jgi:hypothetical protein
LNQATIEEAQGLISTSPFSGSGACRLKLSATRIRDDSYRLDGSRHRVAVAVLAIYLYVIGVLLNRTADNLDDSLQNVKMIAEQAEVIGPAVERINGTGGVVVGALPLLCDGAERIAPAEPAPLAATPAAPPLGLGYLDA